MISLWKSSMAGKSSYSINNKSSHKKDLKKKILKHARKGTKYNISNSN